MKTIKYLSLGLFISLIFIACETKDPNNFKLIGDVKGLKKGTVYLQMEGDSTIVNLDSAEIKGNSRFTLSTTIEEPIVLYLKLFKNDGEEHYIPFFADKGETNISTSLKNFNFDAKITGSKQQAVLEEYLKVMSGYSDKNLELIKENFIAQKANDSLKSDSLQKATDNLIKRKYAYTINFAFNHSDSEVSPYLALYEIPNTNVKYIDSIYNKLTDSVKQSLYGRKLNEVLNLSKTSVSE